MHSSTVLASLFATLAIASPVHQNLHNKRVYEYDIKYEIVTVTVTAGQELVHVQETVYVAPTVPSVTTTQSKSRTRRPTIRSTSTVTTTTPPPPPPPAPTTTTPPPPPPAPTTEAPPPPAQTTPAPAPAPVVEEVKTEAPAPSPEPVAEPEPTQAAAPVVVEAPASSSGDGLIDAALNTHNAYRAKHHAGPVSWDASLASSAASLAGGCTNKHGLIVGGQNIAAKGFSGQQSPGDSALLTEAIDSWYNEVDLFGGLYGQANVDNTAVLHFTQVVWKATTKIGCAVHNCGTQGNIFPGFNAYTIVCNYLAAGNFGGQYAVNVQAP